MQYPPDGFALLAPNNPYWEQFGPIFADPARQLLGFRVERHHCNPVESLHGGAMATFADMQLMALAEYTGEQQSHAPTISLSVDYISPAMLGEWVEAQTAVDRVTRRLLFLRSIITAEGRIVARSHALYRNHEKTGYTLT